MTKVHDEETLKQEIKSIFDKYDRRLDGLDLNTANYVRGCGATAYIDKLLQLITSRDQAIREEAERDTLQWVEDLGKEATKNCTVHNMDEYHRKYGEGVSFKVHNRLTDDYLHSTNPKSVKEQ